MATKIYATDTGSAAISPSSHSSWGRDASNFGRRAGSKTDNGSGTTKTDGYTGSNVDAAAYQWVYGPLEANQISGTVAISMPCSNATFINIYKMTAAVFLATPGGSLRSTLLSAGSYDDVYFTTSKTTMTVTLGLTSRTPTAGDYLVFEVGYGRPDGWVDSESASVYIGEAGSYFNFSDTITRWAPAGLTYGSTTVNVVKDTLAPNNDPTSTGGPIDDYGTQTGTRPPGTSLSSTTGRISGTPTTVGTYQFTIRGTGLDSQFDDSPTITYNIYEVPAGLTYSSMSTRAKRGKLITDNTPSSTGGAIASYAIQTGSLPPGLSLHATTGVISGTPTTNGTYTFTVRATGPYGETTDSATLTYVIFAGNSLNVFSLVKGEPNIG